MMREAPLAEALRAKYPEHVVLASVLGPDGRPNLITLGWCMTTSGDPPMLAISVAFTRYSHACLTANPEFVLAFPAASQAAAALWCGTHSGRDADKFKEAGLEALPARKVKPPLVAGAVANFECRVEATVDTGDHTIFAGRVVAQHLDEEAAKRGRLYNFGSRGWGPAAPGPDVAPP